MAQATTPCCWGVPPLGQSSCRVVLPPLGAVAMAGLVAQYARAPCRVCVQDMLFFGVVYYALATCGAAGCTLLGVGGVHVPGMFELVLVCALVPCHFQAVIVRLLQRPPNH
uniref:Uncharacterized protein n=1 Tax=Alexandrium andersonii TaxID=327968 RepID=A0A7S2JG74_9DINO